MPSEDCSPPRLHAHSHVGNPLLSSFADAHAGDAAVYSLAPAVSSYMNAGKGFAWHPFLGFQAHVSVHIRLPFPDDRALR